MLLSILGSLYLGKLPHVIGLSFGAEICALGCAGAIFF